LLQAFFGIFDGHGGTKASEFAAHNLEKNVLEEVIRRDESDIEEAVKHGYLKTDSDFLKEDLNGGSCCVTALIRNGNLVVSNAGDCRAVISRGGVAEVLTSDHKPSRKDEKERIETQVIDDDDGNFPVCLW
jgi:protein phosphatase 1L